MTTTQAPDALTDERLREIEAGNTDQPIGYNPLVREARMMARELLALRTTGEAVAWDEVIPTGYIFERLEQKPRGGAAWIETTSTRKPHIEERVRNIRPLFAHPPAPQPAVEVKALEWVEDVANTPFGSYWHIAITRGHVASSDIVDGIGMKPSENAFPTPEEARAFCQADFDRRIRSALVGGGA